MVLQHLNPYSGVHISFKKMLGLANPHPSLYEIQFLGNHARYTLLHADHLWIYEIDSIKSKTMPNLDEFVADAQNILDEI